MTNTDIQRALNTLWRGAEGRALKPVRPGPRKQVLVSISGAAHTSLKQQAQKLGYLHNGTGNLSLLLEAIGLGVVRLVPETTPLQKAQAQLDQGQ